MKKFFLLAAAAIVAMAACTKTEVVNTPKSGDINFSAFMHKSTKAAETTVSNLAQFTVTAMQGSEKYIDGQTVTVSSSGVCSDYGTYYWPSDDSELDFFAWGPSANTYFSAVTPTDPTAAAGVQVFTVAPASDAASQVDFVVARTQGKKSTKATDGVNFNFRHALSQVAIAYTNSNKDLTFDVEEWKVVNVNANGTFTLNETSTFDLDAANLAYTDWADNATFTATFNDDFTSEEVGGAAVSTKTSFTGATSMFLVPQNAGSTPGATAAVAYASANKDAAISGQYIAVKMIIKNAENDAVIAGKALGTDPETYEAIWCCWPVQFIWNPGTKYTYVIDLAQGGYKETNEDGIGGSVTADDTALDPVLEDAQIIFTTVTVDAWDAVDKDVWSPTMTLSAASAALSLAGTTSVDITVSNNATGVHASSANAAVATAAVDGTKVTITAVAAGSTTVTITDGITTAYVAVTVTE